MKAPARLQTLIEEGLIDSVVRQLMSGKEAEVFVVRCGTDTVSGWAIRVDGASAFGQEAS